MLHMYSPHFVLHTLDIHGAYPVYHFREGEEMPCKEKKRREKKREILCVKEQEILDVCVGSIKPRHEKHKHL